MVFGALRIDSEKAVSDAAGFCFAAGDITLAEECKTIARQQLGLDKSLPSQYSDFMWDTVRFDLGKSVKTGESVLSDIASRAGPSVELGLLQILVAVIVALPVGIISAIRQDTWMDYALRFFSIALLGIPVFVLAIVVIMVASRYAEGTFLPDWLGPHGSYTSLASDPIQNFKIMAGPALVGGLGTGAIIMRFLRSQMLEVLRQDYVRTAWAKGLKERVVVTRHALKNALIPVLTVIGILLGAIVSGNVVLETIYVIPGIGYYVVAAAKQNDFPAVQGVVLLVALTLVFVNLLVDVAYGWLDPRIRYS
jgi:peptide/nickel transport system permease protein